MNYILFVYHFLRLFKSMIRVQFSEKGSNMRAKEEQTYIYFVDFVDECQGWSVLISFNMHDQ